MPLPAGGKTPWPPLSEAGAYLRYAEHSAWFSGSAMELERFYAGFAGRDRTGFFDPRGIAQPYTSIWKRWAFWARQDPGAYLRGRVHIPMPADVASTSSDLLFSDAPDFVVPEAHVDKPSRKAKAAQTELDRLLELATIRSTLAEAEEIKAALGGVFIKVMWDTKFADWPLLIAVHPDAAVPEFRWGQLTAVTFWETLETDQHVYIRHLERHEPKFILNGLYKGDKDVLGQEVALTTHAATASLQPVVETKIDDLTASYIPNLLPNRQDRKSYLGRSDYAGAEGLFDALDEAWTSWMRDLRLGKSRLLVPLEYMTTLGKGKGAEFDVEKEVYETINLAPQASLKEQILPQQFAIRYQEHSSTVESLIERIVAACGYSASTFGIKSMATVERTATEVKAREHRSLTTRGKKIEYWNARLAEILETFLEVNKVWFSGPEEMRARLDFPASVQESTIDMANSVALLRGAKAVSLQTSILMVHPDWDPDEVRAEITRLETEARAEAQLQLTSGTTDKSNAPGGGAPSPTGETQPGAGQSTTGNPVPQPAT